MGESLQTTPIWLLGLLLFVLTVACAFAGSRLRQWYASRPGTDKLSEAQEGYVVTSVYALLGLLVAFTFGVAMDRFQSRRELVVQDANAIETLYMKAQLLDEPHRSRLGTVLIRYTENRIELATARRDDTNAQKLLTNDDTLLRQLWAAAMPAFRSIRSFDFSSSFVESVTEVMKVDAERKAARRSEIPTTILVILIFYSLAAATMLGGVMKGRNAQRISTVLLALNVLALMLITDLNRPVEGTIHESQEPMQAMLQRLRSNPPAVFP